MLIKNSENKTIHSPKDIVEILRKNLAVENEIDQDKEHFWSVGLSSSNVVQYIELVTLGILNAAVIAPREVFGMAISKRVCSIITAHNHPSDTSKPSSADLKTIKQLSEAGKLLDIPMLDHLIITKSSHWSAQENNII